MPRWTAALAKLTLPRLHAVQRRERLFKVVKEQCRHHPLVWVVGPPGAGKTALIASYLTEHKQRTLWYHIDSGDADLATFFHYLAQAAQAAAGRKQVRLSALTPEFMADVPGFTRRFMRELWSKVPAPAVLVLDNYQDLPAEAALHALLPVALAEFPIDTTLVVISRGEPPSHFARELTHNRVGHIRWEHLRLTLEETLSLASSAPSLDTKTVASLHAKTNGWMAGTVLMLERLKTKNAWNGHAPSEMTEVFHYFANQVFEHMTPQAREALMRTALLPWVTETMAEEVIGDPHAAQVIRDLYQRSLFVDRRADAQVRYQYHDLFREFLLDRCRVHFDGELHSHKRTAAQVAERHGQQGTAIALYAETKSWDDLSRVICESAEKLLSQGRYQTLQQYISLLPAAERQQHPWVLYWSGTSQMLSDPIATRKDLEVAYIQFELSQQDIAGLLLTCSAIIESYVCGVDDMAPTIVWGDRLQQLLHQSHGFPSPLVEARVLTFLQGLIYASPHHPFLAELEASVDRLLYSLDDPASRCGVVATFVNLPLWRGDFRRARQMLDQLSPYMESSLVPPVTRLCWTVMEANHAWNVRNHDQAREKLARAFAIAEEFGILVYQPMILGISAYNALAAGDDQEGERLANLIASKIQPNHRLGQGQCSFYRAGVSLLRTTFHLHSTTLRLRSTRRRHCVCHS